MRVQEAVSAGLSELWTYKLRTALQALGITLGAASFIVTVAMIQGSREEDRKYLEETGGVTLMDVRKRTRGRMRLSARRVSNFGLTNKEVDAVREAVEPLGAVVGAVQTVGGRPFYQGIVPEKTTVFGVTPSILWLEKRSVIQGRYLTQGDMQNYSPVAVLGSETAKELFGGDTAVGKDIQLVKRSVLRAGEGTQTVKNGNRYRVVGVLKKKFYRRSEEQRNWLRWMNRQVHIPLSAAQHRELGSPMVGTIKIRAESLETVEKVRAAVEMALGRVRRGEEDWSILDRKEKLKDWQERRMVYQAAIGGAGLISLLVGAIVIMNILLASFTQRIREVGLRKAVGARDRDVFVQFIVESVLVAGTGGALGVLLGASLADVAGEMIHVRVMYGPGVLILGFTVACGAGVLSGIYPGFRAARLDPVYALRHE